MQPENQEFIQSLVDKAEFTSADEAIDRAVTYWREARERDLAKLKAMIQVGLDQLDRGEGQPFDIDDIKRKLQERISHAADVASP